MGNIWFPPGRAGGRTRLSLMTNRDTNCVIRLLKKSRRNHHSVKHISTICWRHYSGQTV